jgi:hypothetical protein
MEEVMEMVEVGTCKYKEEAVKAKGVVVTYRHVVEEVMGKVEVEICRCMEEVEETYRHRAEEV